MRIHHFGYLADRSRFVQKQERYRDILRLALEDHPQDANRWMDLGTTQRVYFGRNHEALQCYRRAVQCGFPHNDPWIGIAQILLEERDYGGALKALAHLSDSGAEGLQKLEMRGDALHGEERLKDARAQYAEAWKRIRPRTDPRLRRQAASLESKLGYTEVRLGMRRAGMAKMRRAVKAQPDVLDGHHRLVKACVLLGDDGGAADAAEATLKYFLSDALFARAAALSLRAERLERAAEILEIGRKLFPDHEPLRSMQASLKQHTPVIPVIEEEQEPCPVS